MVLFSSLGEIVTGDICIYFLDREPLVIDGSKVSIITCNTVDHTNIAHIRFKDGTAENIIGYSSLTATTKELN